MPRAFRAVVALALGLLVSTGCNQEKPDPQNVRSTEVPTPELRVALQYKTAIEESRRRVGRAAFLFGQAAGKACTSRKDSDIAKMEELLVELRSCMKTVQKETKELTVPPGPAAQELAEVMEKYLENEEHD